MSFTLRVILVIAVGALAAALISPVAAAIVGWAGLHFPFARIFDRTAMVTIAAAIVWDRGGLKVLALLRAGFRNPARNVAGIGRGFLVAMVGVGALLVTATLMGAHGEGTATQLWRALLRYAGAAFVIATIEEGFFRAFLLAGMSGDFGETGAVAASSAVYAFTHLVRSPARFYVKGIHPLIGFQTMGQTIGHLAHPAPLLPTFLGLFLLGIVLGEAFVLTRTVYFSLGMHAAFVIGAKLWPKLTARGMTLPGWLAGYGSQPLVSGAAAWLLTLALLGLLKPLTARTRKATS